MNIWNILKSMFTNNNNNNNNKKIEFDNVVSINKRKNLEYELNETINEFNDFVDKLKKEHKFYSHVINRMDYNYKNKNHPYAMYNTLTREILNIFYELINKKNNDFNYLPVNLKYVGINKKNLKISSKRFLNHCGASSENVYLKCKGSSGDELFQNAKNCLFDGYSFGPYSFQGSENCRAIVCDLPFQPEAYQNIAKDLIIFNKNLLRLNQTKYSYQDLFKPYEKLRYELKKSVIVAFDKKGLLLEETMAGYYYYFNEVYMKNIFERILFSSTYRDKNELEELELKNLEKYHRNYNDNIDKDKIKNNYFDKTYFFSLEELDEFLEIWKKKLDQLEYFKLEKKVKLTRELLKFGNKKGEKNKKEYLTTRIKNYINSLYI